jgi:hypothetical protein
MDKDFFYKVKIKEHKFFKDWFLNEYKDYIDQLPLSSSKTDYQLNRNKKILPPYENEWNTIIKPYMMDFCKNFGVKKYDIHSWFAQYDMNIEHDWHIHPGSHFAVVYYMELPYNENSTEFWKKNFPAEEGEMVFFPSWWIHRSAPQIYNEKKSVIAGNLTFLKHSFLP